MEFIFAPTIWVMLCGLAVIGIFTDEFTSVDFFKGALSKLRKRSPKALAKGSVITASQLTADLGEFIDACNEAEFDESTLSRMQVLTTEVEDVITFYGDKRVPVEQGYLIHSALSDYLLESVTTLGNLPKRRRVKKPELTASVDRQLDIIVTAVEGVKENLYNGVESRITVNQAFLESKFPERIESKLVLDAGKAHLTSRVNNPFGSERNDA